MRPGECFRQDKVDTKSSLLSNFQIPSKNDEIREI